MSPYFYRPFVSFNRNEKQQQQAVMPSENLSKTDEAAMPIMQMPTTPVQPTAAAPTQVCPSCGNFNIMTGYTDMNPNMGNINMMGNMNMMEMDMENVLEKEKDMNAYIGGGSFISDEEARATTNPTPTAGTFLFKELTAYPNYGNPSGNADILYTGDRGRWTFQIPFWLPNIQNLRGQLLISAVLDDHTNQPASRYSARITINNRVVHNGRLPLEHGTPSGRRFTNWRTLTFDVPNLTRNNVIIIQNTSRTNQGDWIGLDWMELRLSNR